MSKRMRFYEYYNQQSPSSDLAVPVAKPLLDDMIQLKFLSPKNKHQQQECRQLSMSSGPSRYANISATVSLNA
jgi:hypothetical protein